ncbi:hypothetical protein Pint_21529 [Pistacia integerrima]|uniref:Uncharacterized protein n=1 Tax=Pistacia integerrima TaxID=434235 RepID=A0ACC0X8L6_9ROSI|nr:hypothetical protein Pint_21529 [Pistacia integerrima]
MYNRHLSCWLIVLLIIFHISQASTFANKVSFCWKFRVHIINALSHDNDNLIIHCYSLDDDLGEHNLRVGDEFTFKFGRHVILTTRFWCDMKYGSDHSKTIDVFTENIGDKYCCHTNKCFWSIREDGIYFSNNNQSWVKWYDWS